MERDEAIWAHILALLAMNMRLLTNIVALAPTPDHARQTLLQYEQQTLSMLPSLISSYTGGDAALSERVRTRSRELIASWFASFEVTKKPGA